MTVTQNRNTIGRSNSLDDGLNLAREGYVFGQNRFEKLDTDAFHTRILGSPVTVMYGGEAASVLHTNTVDTSDDSTDLFTRLMTNDRALLILRSLYMEEWFDAVNEMRGEVVLQDEVRAVLTRVALRWLGIDPNATSVDAESSRVKLEWWARGIIRSTRHELKRRDPNPESVIEEFVERTDDEGRRLSTSVASAQVVDVLQSIVAVSRTIVFAGLASHLRPKWRELFLAGDMRDLENFVHEVRRFYPSTALSGGRVIGDFTWRDHDFVAGDRLLFDSYATHRDERIWDEPGVFMPERFRDWHGDTLTLTPDGVGENRTGIRFAGTRATILLTTQAVQLMTQQTRYNVPKQDLRVSLRKVPTGPESGFVIDRVVRT
jgi:fatty-acid peroxygenase